MCKGDVAASRTAHTVASESNTGSCGTYPVVTSFRRETLPESGVCTPARIWIKVDFPAPFGPMSPMRSPSEIVSDIFSNSGRAPKVLLMDWQLMSRDIAEGVLKRGLNHQFSIRQGLHQKPVLWYSALASSTH